jgi:hypothetical protein
LTEPKYWIYKTLDGPKFGSVVAGFATTLSTVGKSLRATWLVSERIPLDEPKLLRISNITKDNSVLTITAEEFGELKSPLIMYENGLFFSCERRTCFFNFSEIRLLNSTQALSNIGLPIKTKDEKIVAVVINNKLVVISI